MRLMFYKRFGFVSFISLLLIASCSQNSNSGPKSPADTSVSLQQTPSMDGAENTPSLSAPVGSGRPWYFAVVRGYVYQAPYTMDSEYDSKDTSGFGYVKPEWWKNASDREAICEGLDAGEDELYVYSSDSSLPMVYANRTLENYFDPNSLDTYPGLSSRFSKLEFYDYVKKLSPKDRNYYASGICVDYYRVDSMPPFNTALTISSDSNLGEGAQSGSWTLNADEVTNGYLLLDTDVEVEKNYEPLNMWVTK